MFDLAPDDVQTTIVETLREFAEQEVRPLAREAEKAGEPPEVISKQLVEMGFYASIPEDYGGAGVFSTVTSMLITEELAWGDPGIAAAVVWSSHPAVIIGMVGTDEQKSRLLPQFSSGEFIKGSVMLYEHPPLSSGAPLRTTARRYGKDWIVEGEKRGVLWPKGADLRIVVAGIEGSDEIGAFVLEKDSGVEVRKDNSAAGKLGLRAAPTGDVALRRVVLKSDALLGAGSSGGSQLARALSAIRLSTGAIAVGLARAAMEYASHYATERVAFGKPIGAFQGISFMIADMATIVDGARLAVWSAADAIDKGSSAGRAVAIANATALDAALQCGTDSVQVLGGHGFITDHPVEKWYRDAAALDAFEGSLDARAYLAGKYEG